MLPPLDFLEIRKMLLLLLPLVLDEPLQRSHQFLCGKFMDAESFGSIAGHQAVHVVPLVSKEREHQHWHSIADPLVDAMTSSVSHEHFGFRVGCGDERGRQGCW